MKRIAIIGGGAAGLACAVSAASSCRALGLAARIVLFERDDRVGRTVLATGNGRCNFSNSRIDPTRYNNADFVAQVLAALETASCTAPALSWLAPAGSANGVEGLRDVDALRVAGEGSDRSGVEREGAADAVHRLFSLLGLEWREEADGRQYPLANKASSVLDVLRFALDRLGVRCECERTVALVDPPRKPGALYTLRMSDGVFERADVVVVAVGGKASASLQIADWLKPPIRPVLGPLATDTELVKELNNIRVRANVSLLREEREAGASGFDGGGYTVRLIASERGEVMFRKYGVSGIAVFNLSRYARRGDVISIDFLAEASSGDAWGFCEARARRLDAANPSLTLDDFLRGLLLPQVAHVVLKSCGLSGGAVATRDSLRRLARALSDFRLTVHGIGDEANCQVQRGGYGVEAVDARTLESRELAGLYLVGEALDVDGPCGGYNLHWAWASGMLAGAACANALW